MSLKEVAFDAARVYHQVDPGQMMVIPPGQDAAIRITPLPSGGCLVDVLKNETRALMRGE